MTKLRYHMAAALILAGASTQLTSCKSAETPAPAASAPAEKAPAPEAPACRDCIPVTADNFIRAERIGPLRA
ncbi:MAG: hypothetical protein WA869_11125 [Alloacidobacterium sp.]|jgi:hypothetical protein